MKVCLSLISLFFLKINQEVRGERNLENLVVLQHAETVGPINRIKGENITVTCEFGYTGKTRFFCKGTCEGKNILIQTTEDRDENGRFSIRYEKRSRFKSDFLNVSITDLKPSDSGWYRCRSDETGLGNVIGTLIKTQYADFDLVVTDDSLKPKWTPRPFIRSTFLQAASTTAAAATTTTSTTSSTQTQSFSPSPSETIKSSDPLLYVGLSLAVLIVLLATALLIFCQRKNLHLQKGLQLYLVLTLIAKIILLPTTLVIFCWNSGAMKSEGLQLYVFLSLVVKILLLSTPLVIFCWKWRAMTNKDPLVETEYDDVSQINPEREETKEDRQNNSSAEEISSD